MSEKQNDGGPAFPILPPVDETGRTAVGYPYPDSGMSLLDYFAGQAAAGLCNVGNVDLSDHAPAIIARDAYLVADALLAEREKRRGE